MGDGPSPLYRQPVRSGSVESNVAQGNCCCPGYGNRRCDSLFASRPVLNESIGRQYVMSQKGCPEDCLHNGTLQKPEMPGFLSHPNRRFFAFTLMLLFSVAGLPAQNSAPVPSISLPGSQSPFTGSEPEGKATPEVLQLGLQDAIDRGLRNNLGLLLSGDQTTMARGERWKELSDLLPNLSARVQEDAQTQSLAALGFKASLFPTPLPRVLGPFNYFDARASVSQSLFNFHDLEKERSASDSLKSAQYTFKDARELV